MHNIKYGTSIDNDLKKHNNLSSDCCGQKAGKLVRVRYFNIEISNKSKFPQKLKTSVP
jgi:hypothetical protein